MSEQDRLARLKREIVEISQRLYGRHLVAGQGGNVSARAQDRLLITPRGASLGFVRAEDLLEIDLEGRVLSGEGRPSAETRLHLAIYRRLPAQAVVHAHPLHATALTLKGDRFKPLTFETLLSMGQVRVLPQDTPTVSDTAAVVDALRFNNVVLLRRHGAVAIGQSLKDAYFLTDLLEEAAHMALLVGDLSGSLPAEGQEEEMLPDRPAVSYKLFSEEHMAAIAELINGDPQARRRGRATRLTTRLGILLDDTEQLYSIHLQDGEVVFIGQEDDAEFLISGPRDAWQLVFGGQVDPFVAVTQRRLKLRGDLGKLSKWYSPFYRIFELWKRVPIE